MIAELAEELGKQWFAPLQGSVEPISFQIFTNNFSQLAGNKEVCFSSPQKKFVGIRYEKENRRVIRKFQQSVIKPSVVDRSLDKLHRIYRKFSDKKITQKVVNRGDLGLIALHMQPELNTEPLAEL